jgi:hypothetical protein
MTVTWSATAIKQRTLPTLNLSQASFPNAHLRQTPPPESASRTRRVCRCSSPGRPLSTWSLCQPGSSSSSSSSSVLMLHVGTQAAIHAVDSLQPLQAVHSMHVISGQHNRALWRRSKGVRALNKATTELAELTTCDYHSLAAGGCHAAPLLQPTCKPLTASRVWV